MDDFNMVGFNFFVKKVVFDFCEGIIVIFIYVLI